MAQEKPWPTENRGLTLVDALNKEGHGMVVNGLLAAYLIAKGNDQLRADQKDILDNLGRGI